jgi:hypothetical protein
MKNLKNQIETTNVVTELITLKVTVKNSKLENKDKLSLQTMINKKVCILKLDEQKSKLNERNEKQKPLTEKTTFKKDIKVNLLSLNNIVTTIKKADKERIFEGKEIVSKYKFLFAKGFNNTTFYGLITLSQFNKLITKGEFFNSDTITENCERLAKKDFSEIESICNKGYKVKELIENKDNFTTVHLIELFTKL